MIMWGRGGLDPNSYKRLERADCDDNNVLPILNLYKIVPFSSVFMLPRGGPKFLLKGLANLVIHSIHFVQE